MRTHYKTGGKSCSLIQDSLLGLFAVVVTLGCSPQGTVASQADAGLMRSQGSQIIVRFKPDNPGLAKADCAAAYISVAGVQKGVNTVVVGQLFSGAQVIRLQPSQAPNAALSFVQYLSKQQAVDYAELDGTLQIKPSIDAAAKPAQTLPPAALNKALHAGAHSQNQAEVKFRSACGVNLPMPG